MRVVGMRYYWKGNMVYFNFRAVSEGEHRIAVKKWKMTKEGKKWRMPEWMKKLEKKEEKKAEVVKEVLYEEEEIEEDDDTTYENAE